MILKKLDSFILLVSLYFINSFLLNAQTIVSSNPLSSIPTEEEIRQALKDRIDIEHQSMGMVVGIITPKGKKVISYGRLSREDSREPDGNTIFEIGSVTKIFTALLLTDMIERGEAGLYDPLDKFLPKEATVPEKEGRKISLADLATQTSGLPFWPAGIPNNDSAAIFIPKYTVEQIYQFLSTYKIQTELGKKWEYSNLGFGLLGHALCLKAGKDYESLLNERILKPLKMTNTSINILPAMKKNICTGYNNEMNKMPEWNLPLMPGCGSIRSCANDMLSFLENYLGYVKSSLKPAMDSMLIIKRPGPQLIQQALGWWVIPFGTDDDWILTHPGETFGFSSVVACDPKLRCGVVVLSNNTGGDVSSIAWHILRPKIWPWTVIPKKKTAISIDSQKMDIYSGEYKTDDGTLISIEHDSTALILKSPTTPPEGIRLNAEKEDSFNGKDVNLQVTFSRNNEKGIKGLTIHFGTTDTPAVKIEKGNK
jgi:serine-type D-Ala-D-Ala carboxypeptidase/endopeptidase